MEHEHSIRIIVEKIDSDDIKVSELALQLLVTAVGIDNDSISLLASSKICQSLKDLAVSKGQRNGYKVLVSHMTHKDVLNGSFQYDTYAVTLINYLVSGEELHRRMEERRLLNALKFDRVLRKLEDRCHRANSGRFDNGAGGRLSISMSVDDLRLVLLNQIQTYRFVLIVYVLGFEVLS